MKTFGKITTGVALAATALGVAGWLTWDWAAKRLNFPERNVLFRAHETVYYAGGEKHLDSEHADREIVCNIYKGSMAGGDTKTEDLMLKLEYKLSDDNESYILKDIKNFNVASGLERTEGAQSGPWISGRKILKEQFGALDTAQTPDIENSLKDGLIMYGVRPDRGLHQPEINILRRNGERKLGFRLDNRRSIILGWKFGDWYRAGTTLEKYFDTTGAGVDSIMSIVHDYNQLDPNTSQSKREGLLNHLTAEEQKIPRKVVYATKEDGIIDWLPQESTIYLLHDPGLGERAHFKMLDWAGQFLKEKTVLGWLSHENYEDMVLRVEQHWNFFPGNWPGLNQIHKRSEDGKQVFSLFDKWNNGGYEVIDKYGQLAAIEIKDFWFNYDQDLLYKYYLDKNGDGKIDKTTELIGVVLYKATHGEKERQEQQIGKGIDKKDVTYNYDFSFMDGYETDPVKRYTDFMLCAYLESLLPDQLSKGYGKDSHIGLINEVRCSIILNNDRTLENISRVMTTANDMVAAHDIYALLNATRRPYAKTFGEVLDLKSDAPTLADTSLTKTAVLVDSTGQPIDTTTYTTNPQQK